MSKRSAAEAAKKRFQTHGDLQKLEEPLPHIRDLQKLASQHGIHDVEPWFVKWEADFARSKTPLNNPKISQEFVRSNGIELYRNDQAPKADDADIRELLGDVGSPPTEDDRKSAMHFPPRRRGEKKKRRRP